MRRVVGGCCRAGVVRAALVCTLALACLGAGLGDVARGDSAWADRARGQTEGQPQTGPILAAVSSYEAALAVDPQSLEARWKLLRALHFAGDFAIRDDAERREIFDRALEVSQSGLERLSDRLASGLPPEEMVPEVLVGQLESLGIQPSDVARLYFWSAINWGAWSRDVGLLSAVRQGVANRLYSYTRLTIALEPKYDEGGAFRLLGRLHAELPRVPFVSAWVDRDQALPLIERALELAPANPGNRLLLALTLLEQAPERRSEALVLLEQVQQLTPRASMQIEDLAMRKQARERLAADAA